MDVSVKPFQRPHKDLRMCVLKFQNVTGRFIDQLYPQIRSLKFFALYLKLTVQNTYRSEHLRALFAIRTLYL